MSVHYFKCDPEKNDRCKRAECFLNGGHCALTTKMEYSIDGQPLGPNEGWHTGQTHARKVRENNQNNT